MFNKHNSSNAALVPHTPNSHKNTLLIYLTHEVFLPPPNYSVIVR